MKDKYYLFLMILTEKTLDDGKKVPDSILIQVLDTDGKIIKQGQKNGLYDAMDIGTIWLERAIADSKNNKKKKSVLLHRLFILKIKAKATA